MLNKAKAKDRRGKLFLLNASREFVKGDPKNYIPEHAIVRITEIFTGWKEVEKYSRIVSREEIAKNDFNISPSRYIHTGAADEYRPISEIVEELQFLEEQTLSTDRSLKAVYKENGARVHLSMNHNFSQTWTMRSPRATSAGRMSGSTVTYVRASDSKMYLIFWEIG